MMTKTATHTSTQDALSTLPQDINALAATMQTLGQWSVQPEVDRILESMTTLEAFIDRMTEGL